MKAHCPKCQARNEPTVDSRRGWEYCCEKCGTVFFVRRPSEGAPAALPGASPFGDDLPMRLRVPGRGTTKTVQQWFDETLDAGVPPQGSREPYPRTNAVATSEMDRKLLVRRGLI